MSLQLLPNSQQAVWERPMALVRLTTATTALGSGITTKIALNSADIDTMGWWDNTNHRYTPKQAGYYAVQGSVSIALQNTTASLVACILVLQKNGSAQLTNCGITCPCLAATPQGMSASGAGLVLLNGSTDFVELWAQGVANTTINVIGGAAPTTIMTIQYMGQ